MPTTLRSVQLNSKITVEQEQEGSIWFPLACAAVLLLAAVAIFTLPMAVNVDVSDITWLAGP